MENGGWSARVGLVLFALYGAAYAAFVLLSAFKPSLLEQQIAGVNGAIVGGVGLILGAIVLAALYCWICAAEPNDASSK
jgi:uncharacterized membrane protein (DUF485 family)